MTTVAELLLLRELDHAERQAWLSLARYKFQMFGYWAAIWVHLNRIGGFKRKNPFRSTVRLGKEMKAAYDHAAAKKKSQC